MKSETPIKSKTPEVYESGAEPASPQEKLSKDQNWSTGDYNMKKQRQQAHKEALRKEMEHYGHIHPYDKPKPRWSNKEE